MANPAGATHRILGVYSEHLTAIIAEVLKRLGDQTPLRCAWAGRSR